MATPKKRPARDDQFMRISKTQRKSKITMEQKVITEGGCITASEDYVFMSKCCVEHIEKNEIRKIMSEFRCVGEGSIKLFAIDLVCTACSTAFTAILTEDHNDEVRWNVVGFLREDIKIAENVMYHRGHRVFEPGEERKNPQYVPTDRISKVSNGKMAGRHKFNQCHILG